MKYGASDASRRRPEYVKRARGGGKARLPQLLKLGHYTVRRRQQKLRAPGER